MRIMSVQGVSTFEGTVEDCSDNPLSSATIMLADCYFNILGIDTTDSSGDYGFSVTLNGNAPYYLTATKTRFNSGMETVYGGGTNDFELVGITEKIGVFFWASDAGREQDIDDYIDILEEEHGYTKFYKYEDCANVAAVQSAMNTIDAYEHDQDTVFVYIFGHGSTYNEHSHTKFKEDGTTISSDDFRDYMDALEAPRKCIVVESCYSGYWVDDFAASPYLAISCSREDKPAFSYLFQPLPYEGRFSHYFFAQLNLDATGTEGFSIAYSCCQSPVGDAQYAQISDCSSYVWFGS